MIATTRLKPAEPPLIFTGKQQTSKPFGGSNSRFASFSIWQEAVGSSLVAPAKISDRSLKPVDGFVGDNTHFEMRPAQFDLSRSCSVRYFLSRSMTTP